MYMTYVHDVCTLGGACIKGSIILRVGMEKDFFSFFKGEVSLLYGQSKIKRRREEKLN